MARAHLTRLAISLCVVVAALALRGCQAHADTLTTTAVWDFNSPTPDLGSDGFFADGLPLVVGNGGDGNPGRPDVPIADIPIPFDDPIYGHFGGLTWADGAWTNHEIGTWVPLFHLPGWTSPESPTTLTVTLAYLGDTAPYVGFIQGAVYPLAGTRTSLTDADHVRIEEWSIAAPTVRERVFVFFPSGAALDSIRIDTSVPFTFVPGDLNFDEQVNIFDVNLVSSNWGTAGPAGDANADGAVDIFDLNFISANWNSSVPVVDEPSTLALVCTALVCLRLLPLGRGKRRLLGPLSKQAE